MIRPSPLLHLAIATALPLLMGTACGGDSEPVPGSATSPAAPPPAEASDTARGLTVVDAVIEEEWKRLASLEGREGILADERRYSLFDEELIIRDFFQDRRGGFFVDVGCAWPKMVNNTYYLEKHLGWTGFGIDALAEYGPEWRELRPGSRFFAYLVSDESDDEATFYRSPSTGLSSIDPDMAAGSIFYAGLEPEKMTVPSITLNDLLDREGIEKIDLLAMDIEGHEATALAGFDIDRFRPELVVTERPVNKDGEEQGPVFRYFEEHGYEVIEKYLPYDTINRYFKRKGS